MGDNLHGVAKDGYFIFSSQVVFRGKYIFLFSSNICGEIHGTKIVGGTGATCFSPSKSALIAKMHVNVSYSTFSLIHVVHLHKQLNCHFYFVINF